MTAPRSSTGPDHATRKIDLSLTQIAAAALASVTAAVLGSRLGAAGTLLGAAGASAITTTATALYRASLDRSRERVRSFARRPRDRSQLFATLRWGAVVVGAVGSFVLAMMVVTGFEWASGETVAGNDGTTIGQVISPPGPRTPAGPPAPSSSSRPPSETPTATTTAPGTTSPDGSASVSAEQNPSMTSGAPTPSEASPTPPLIPTGIPDVGN